MNESRNKLDTMNKKFMLSLLILPVAFSACLKDNDVKSEHSDTTAWIIENRSIPAPKSSSDILFNSIKSTPKPNVRILSNVPQNESEWKIVQRTRDSINAQNTLQLANSLSVSIEQKCMDGIPVRLITPSEIDQDFSKSLFIHVHGGAYVFNSGTAGAMEAVIIAHQIKIPVISIDYRMPPEHPFPAALDDMVVAYSQIINDYPDQTLFIGGTSAGGGLAMSTILKLIDNNQKLPVAIFAGTPWTDLTETGDSYFINRGIDRLLVTYGGLLEESAKLYANGTDLKDPYLSPIYGDLSKFPPTFLLSGTRDLFLSNTVRAHRKLRDAGVEADLVVLEGMSHGDYLFVSHAPESIAAFKDLTRFMKKFGC